MLDWRSQGHGFNPPSLDKTRITKYLNLNKAPGYDDIPTRHIKAAAHSLSPFLSSIFNSCLQSGQYPDELKIARVTPLHKWVPNLK